MNQTTLKHKDEWSCQHANLYIEICHWGKDYMNDGKGVWNYYIVIPERLCPEKFKSLWLDDKVIDGRSFVLHDYMRLDIANCEWHGGVTYYEKIGHTVGHRLVKLGCDYNHLWDSEAGYPYDLAWVEADARHTAEEVSKMLGLYVETK